MDDAVEKELNRRIRQCHWRVKVHGVYICTGSCNVCSLLIDRGRCTTISDYIKELKKSEQDKESVDNT